MAICILMVSLVMGVNAYFAFGFVADLPVKAQAAVSCYALFYLFVCLRLVSADLSALAAFCSHAACRVFKSGPRSHEPWTLSAAPDRQWDAVEVCSSSCPQCLSRSSRRKLAPLKEKLLWPQTVAN